MDEDLNETASRELEEETGLKNIYLEQVSMWGKPGRDPRDRTITALHMALVDKRKVRVQAGDDASAARWFAITGYTQQKDFFEEEKTVKTKKIILENGTVLAPRVRQTVCYAENKCEHTEIIDTSDLSFDHAHCIIDAYEKLKDRLLCSDFAYGILGRTFRAADMKKLYDAAFLKSWDPSGLAKLRAVEETGDGRLTWSGL
jgi:hypothetical protein